MYSYFNSSSILRELSGSGQMVYVCSPLSAPTAEGIKKNMEKANFYAREISSRIGCKAIAPHGFLPQYFNDHVPEERQLCLDIGLTILKSCKAMIICDNLYSDGMIGEIIQAMKLGIPVLSYGEVMKIGHEQDVADRSAMDVIREAVVHGIPGSLEKSFILRDLDMKRLYQ